MATIQNARDTLLQAAGTRLGNVTLPSNVAVDFAYVTGATKPSNNADVTTSILTNSGTSIVMNNANLFKSNSGAGGVFIGSGGLFGKNSGGVETFAIDASTGAARFKGDIDTAGLARFGGANSQGGYVSAVIANASSASATGILAYGSGDAAIRADGQSNSHAVVANVSGSGKAGVNALSTHASGYAATFTNSGGGTGIAVDTGTYSGSAFAIDCYGKFKLSNHAFEWNGYSIAAPAGGSDVLREDGTWGVAGAASYAGTSGEVNNASNAALRCLTGAAIQQTDGNFVVYNGATVIGSATGGFPSDKRMKSGIKATARKGLEVISALQVVDFTWKSGTPQRTQNKGAKVTGFTAQQVAEVLPEIVTVNRGADGKGDETLLLNKAEMIPFVVKAMQELLSRVEALEANP